ncbi:MAG: endolytic transglycosylase MltG [Streptosporangiaceae bacterium]
MHHEPRHRDPRSADEPRAEDSPWRRTQRVPRPETTGWHSGGPAQASYDGPGGGYPPGRPDDQDPGDQYEDEPGDMFVPGFGSYDDEDEDVRPSPRRGGRGQATPPPASRGRSRRDSGRPRRRRSRWIAPLVALLVILVPIAVGGAYGYSYYQNKYHPADYSGPGTGYLLVQVTSGDTATSLAPKLQQLGVVASSRAFVLAAEHSTSSVGLLPGFYGMHKHMQASLAYALLLNPKALVEIPVTIPEGWRLTQIVAGLAAKSRIPASDYDKVLKDPASLHLPSFANGKPEGYLFPATYDVLPHETALGVLTAMVQRFDQEAAMVNLPAAASRVHLTESQVIVMASLVQAEGGRLSDYPKIARVIYNRLAQGMQLQLDSTVLYGLNTYGIVASDAQLASTSPYNTYKHKGLPPGPIDSPGNAAIQAVLSPATGSWLWFVTVNPKTHETLFTSSEAQFQQYRAELEHNLGQG